MPSFHSSRLCLPTPHLTAALALATLLTWLICWRPFSAEERPSEAVALQCRLTAEAVGSVALRLDEGHGFASNVPAQITAALPASAAPVVVNLPLPPGRIRSLRVGLFGSPTVTLSGLRIQSQSSGTLAGWPLGLVKPMSGTRATFTDDQVVLRSENGRVLQFEVTLPSPVTIPSGNEPWAVEIFGTFTMLGALLWLLPPLVAKRVSPAWAEKWQRGMSTLQAGASRSPALTLGAVGLCAAIVSSAPVVWGGRSFVAPANGAPLLYFGTPTLPGGPAEVQEDPKGTDVAAMVWQNLPYSALQHRAIFQDHEWPLWNRYNGGGVPLLGQGLSSLGDPLHWLPILADGAGWAWDAKFILAKALFCFGMGLCAWLLTRQLGFSALLAASSAWLGFFAFRFNHPAFFGVCYAPWVLLPWLARRKAQGWRSCTGWAAALVLADMMELNSGTVKEATMLLLCVNATGVLLLLLQPLPWRERWRPGAVLGWASVLFVLLSAPFWLLFLDALRHAATLSEAPRAFQQQPGLLLGFFDEIFTQNAAWREQHTHPSVNGLILCGVLWLLVQWRRLMRDRSLMALAVASALALALVYGVVPPGWITALPFIGQLQHVDNIFGCVLVLLLPLLGAAGLVDCWSTAGDPAWVSTWRRTLGLGALLLAAYLGLAQVIPRPEVFGWPYTPPLHSRFFLVYAPALLAAVALLPWALRWLRASGGTRAAGLALALGCCVVLHFRHGMYAETKFDGYVMNPKMGMELRAQSFAIDRVVRRLTEPYRAYGLSYTLSPGYAAMLGLEGICGPDPLANREFRELCRAAQLPLDLGWRLRMDESTLSQQLPIYDLLNQRYFLREAEPEPPPALTLVGRADLEIYESKTAWPRAFFTDEVQTYRSADDFVRLIRQGDGRPFAAQQAVAGATTAPSASRQIVPAHDYVLTSNGTTFTVQAPGAGVAVLGENFEERNFRVLVNGTPAEYFRVNHFAKGVRLPAAGLYRISFTYAPHFWVLSLWLAGAGLVLGLASVLLCWRSRRRLSANQGGWAFSPHPVCVGLPPRTIG